METQDLAIPTPDGATIRGTWFPGHDAAKRSVILLPAMATPARFYASFARHLADHGWGVLTFDYRGVGRSRLDDDSDVTCDTWSQQDALAAYETVVKEADDPQFLAVVAHSVGGQLFGQSPLRTVADAALFVGSQRGVPSLFDGVWRARLEVAWRLIPASVRLLGRLPKSPVTLREHVPGGALVQWVRWCREGRFSDWAGHGVEDLMAEFAGPLTIVGLEHDAPYAPPRAVDALASAYKSATIRRLTLRASDIGLTEVGHFSVFRKPESQAWLARELDSLHANARTAASVRAV